MLQARWREEDRSLQEAERALMAEFEHEKDQQLRRDQRVFAAVAVLAAVMYLVVRSGFDVRQGGVYGLYQWALTVIRCDFLPDTANATVYCSSQTSHLLVVLVTEALATFWHASRSAREATASLCALPPPPARRLPCGP